MKTELVRLTTIGFHVQLYMLYLLPTNLEILLSGKFCMKSSIEACYVYYHLKLWQNFLYIFQIECKLDQFGNVFPYYFPMNKGYMILQIIFFLRMSGLTDFD